MSQRRGQSRRPMPAASLCVSNVPLRRPRRGIIRPVSLLLLKKAALLWLFLVHPAWSQTITIGEVGTGSLNRWPTAIAAEKGYFRALGLTADFVSVPSSAGVMQQLAAGSIDMGTGGLVDPIRAINQGAPITLFRTELVVAPYELDARPEIKAIADLRGKIISIGGAKDITRIYLERLLSGANLKLTDVDLVYAGATAPRYAALASASIDATLLSPPFNFKARDAGMTNLVNVADVIRDFPYTGYAVAKPWAAHNHAAILNFLAAYRLAVDWFMDPANRAEAVGIAQRLVKVDRADIEQTYDFFHRLKIFDRTGAIADSGLDVLLARMTSLGDLKAPVDAASFYDPGLALSSR